VPTPVKDQLRTAVAAYAPLASLLTVAGTLNWYDTQLPQTATFPAIVMQQITGPKTYTFLARLATVWARYQFTIWGGQFSAGSEMRDTLARVLPQFLDQVNLIGIAGLQQYPNFIVGDRDSVFPQTDGPIFQKIMDAMIFSNELS
jgi:hypothetical protein